MELSLENREKIIECLNNGECFICGKKQFKKPISHIWQAHGIFGNEIKDILLVNRNEGFCDDDLREKLSIYARKNIELGLAKNFKPKSYIVRTGGKKKSLQLKNGIGKKVHEENLKKGRIKQFGTSNGYPDSYYIQLCYKLTGGSAEFVEVNLQQFAIKLGLNYRSLYTAIKERAVKRNIIQFKNDKNTLYARMVKQKYIV